MATLTAQSNGHIDLPEALAEHVASAIGVADPPLTMAAVLTMLADSVSSSNGGIDPTAMYSTEETRHEVHLDRGVRYIPCFSMQSPPCC